MAWDPGQHSRSALVVRGAARTRCGLGRCSVPRANQAGVVRHFLRRTWISKEIDEQLWAYDVLTTKAAGAEHVPLHFLSANLLSADIHTVYEQLRMPVWMSHGVRGDFADYRGKVIVESRPNWQFSVFPTGALPYFEVSEDFCKAFDRFLVDL